MVHSDRPKHAYLNPGVIKVITVDGLLVAQHEAAYKGKIFADALAWSASIAVHRAAVPCETPGAWQLPLLFGALPSWERALKKEWSNPS